MTFTGEPPRATPADAGVAVAGTTDRRPEPGDPELTIDQLAAAVGMTVRTVRSYTTRGLLPPPRLRGRTGLYGTEHIARLSALREMLEAGYTLAAAERVLAEAPTGLTAPGLDVFRTLLHPWQPELVETVDSQVLAARLGTDLDEARLRRLERLGVVARLPDGRLELGSPMLARAGIQLAALGIDTDRVLDAQEELDRHARAMAEVCVQLFRDGVWRPFVDAGAPEEGWPEVREALDRSLPVAAQAVLATFRRALADAIEEAVEQGRADGTGPFWARPPRAEGADPAGRAEGADPAGRADGMTRGTPE